MSGPHDQPLTRRRALLLGVAGLLTASGMLAVAILLIGEFGETQGRILGTTALLGAFGVLALPAAMLLDQARAPRLAQALVVLSAAGAATFLALIWQDDPPQALAKTATTVAVVGVAVAQTAALVARRRAFEPRIVRMLFVASVLLAAAAATLLSVIVWAEVDSAPLARILGSLVVLDLLAVALQPILARARAAGVALRMRITTAPAASTEVSAEGRDVAAAVAAGIRTAEAGGGRVVAVEILERAEVPPG